MLQIKEISKTFNPGTVNEKKALRSLSLTLADGDFVTVIGGNGAGKSTLLNAIAGTWFVDEERSFWMIKMLPDFRNISVPNSWAVCSRTQ